MGLSLSSLKTKQDLSHLKLDPLSYRGDWIYGFGWDENKFLDLKPDRQTLDLQFPKQPVVFVRADGHSSWLNTEALVRLGFFDTNSKLFQDFKDDIVLDEQNKPTGLLKEAAHLFVYTKLPQETEEQYRQYMLEALQTFRKEGFTHIRDMTSSVLQLQIAQKLEQENKLNMHIEHHFVFEKGMDLQNLVNAVAELKKADSKLLKVRGIKFFFDGSLGSETALLSKPYPSGGQGRLGFNDEEVKQIIATSWKAGLDVSVHVIGDQATHKIILTARELSALGLLGRIHLEHVQVLRPETIQLMKPLHLLCHLQPCHWLSDRLWLKEKLGSLYEYSFPWESLRRAQIPFHFGSDSPIEKSSLHANLRALQSSVKEGIPRLNVKDPLIYHCYTQKDSVQTQTHFEGEIVKRIIFDQQCIFES